MGKFLKWKWAPFVALVVVAGFLLFLAIKPYLSWKSYTIDNFISISYPSDWHLQVDNYKALSGVEYLFLISDYEGQLSRQDRSSLNQAFLVEGNRVSNSKVKDFDNFVEPFLSFCEDGHCSLQKSEFNKNGLKVIKLSMRALKLSYFQGEYYLFIQGDGYFYEIHIGYFEGQNIFSNLLRQGILSKVLNSIEIK